MNKDGFLQWFVLGCTCACSAGSLNPRHAPVASDNRRLPSTALDVQPKESNIVATPPSNTPWLNPLRKFQLPGLDAEQKAKSRDFVAECPKQDGPTLEWCHVPKEVAILHPLGMPDVIDAGICRKGECIPNVRCVEECGMQLAPEAKRLVEQRKAQCAKLVGKTEASTCMSQIGALDSPETDWAVESLLQCLLKCGFIADKYRNIVGPKQVDPTRTEGGIPDGH